MDPVDLERLLDGELKQLPHPRAPRTLLPRVMAAASHAARPAAASGWSTWPQSRQFAALAMLAALAAGFAWLVLAPPAPVAETAQSAGKALAIMRALWDVVLLPAAGYVFILGLALALACAAAWAALEVALGGAPQR